MKLPAQLSDFLDVIPAVLQAPHRSMQCTYDEPADVISMNFEPGADATDSELGPNDIIVRYRGEEIIGLTILLRSGPYRVYFYSHEMNEPAHVHVDRDAASCKFWLSPVALASNLGFRAHELRTIERVIEDSIDELLDEWEAIHGDAG